MCFAIVELNFFLHVKYEVSKLTDKLRNKCNDMSRPGSYFHKPDLFLDMGHDILADHIPNSM